MASTFFRLSGSSSRSIKITSMPSPYEPGFVGHCEIAQLTTAVIPGAAFSRASRSSMSWKCAVHSPGRTSTGGHPCVRRLGTLPSSGCSPVAARQIEYPMTSCAPYPKDFTFRKTSLYSTFLCDTHNQDSAQLCLSTSFRQSVLALLSHSLLLF